MTLRPGGGPARLLLELWLREEEGHPITCLNEVGEVVDLLLAGHLERFKPAWALYRLTPAGREAARALESSS